MTHIYNNYEPPFGGMPIGRSEDYDGYIHPLPAPESDRNFFGAQREAAKAKQKHSQEDFREAKYRLMELVWSPELKPREAAIVYMGEWPSIAAEPLRNSPRDNRQAAWKAFNRTTRPAVRLFGSLDQPHFYTLHAVHLGLPDFYSHAENFFMGSHNEDLRSVWHEAIKKHFSGQTYLWKLENAERFHVHIIASHDAALPRIKRGGEVVKRIQPGTEEKTLAYFFKPHATYTETNLAQWIGKKLPEYWNHQPKHSNSNRDMNKNYL